MALIGAAIAEECHVTNNVLGFDDGDDRYARTLFVLGHSAALAARQVARHLQDMTNDETTTKTPAPEETRPQEPPPVHPALAAAIKREAERGRRAYIRARMEGGSW